METVERNRVKHSNSFISRENSSSNYRGFFQSVFITLRNENNNAFPVFYWHLMAAFG